MVKHLLSTVHMTKRDVEEIFKKTDELKNKQSNILKGKTLAMYFEKPSLRTVISFEVAMQQLGGHAIFLHDYQVKLGERESVKDFAKVLSGYVDGIMARLFSHNTMYNLAEFSSVPVINGLDELEHPCQALTDLYTIREFKKLKKGNKIAFLGDGKNNTFTSLIYLCKLFGLTTVVSFPEGEDYEPYASENSCIYEHDPMVACGYADIIYTDTFISMGKENNSEKRIKDLEKYKLTEKLLKLAKKGAIVMHPMPIHWHEITEDVAYGKNSVIFKQAENRLHVQKAILALLLRGKK